MWSHEQEQVLCRFYPNTRISLLSTELNKTHEDIHRKAEELGLESFQNRSVFCTKLGRKFRTEKAKAKGLV